MGKKRKKKFDPKQGGFVQCKFCGKPCMWYMTNPQTRKFIVCELTSSKRHKCAHGMRTEWAESQRRFREAVSAP